MTNEERVNGQWRIRWEENSELDETWIVTSHELLALLLTFFDRLIYIILPTVLTARQLSGEIPSCSITEMNALVLFN